MTDNAAAGQLVDAFEQGTLSRRQLVAQLMAIGAASAGFTTLAGAAEPATKPATFSATSIDHLALAVTDVKRSVAFYEKHLGLKLTRGGGDADGSAFLNCGERDKVPRRQTGPAPLQLFDPELQRRRRRQAHRSRRPETRASRQPGVLSGPGRAHGPGSRVEPIY
jgi:catechol 2,3-dioxygenase-like lactoylglutathione lyase family enzyme